MEEQRAFENIEKWLPDELDTSGAYGIPTMDAVNELPQVDKWVRFCDIRTITQGGKKGVHFFTQDYQFQRVWFQPDRYLPALLRVGAVLSPDFSLYADTPKALQVYNHYRKHWLGAYWQRHGITVIPTIAWSDKNSIEWCFDGEPVGSVVAVSSVGTQRQGSEARRLFEYGYDAMLERLRPTVVLFWGHVPNVCKGNIINVQAAPDHSRRNLG